MPELHLPGHWQACADAFLQSILERSGSARSRETYASALRRFFSDPHKSPDQYTRSDVLAFLSSPSTSKRNRGAPPQPQTRNSRLMVLNSFYRFAASYEVDGVPILQSKPPVLGLKYLKVGSASYAMTEAEIERLFAVIPDTLRGIRDRAIFLTYFLTAKRRAEIINLKVGDIQESTVIDPDGTRRQVHVFRYRAKGKSRTVITAELPALAYEAIVRYWRVSGRWKHLKPTEPVFTSVRPHRKHIGLDGGYVNTLLKEYCAAAGLSPSYSLHTLRHTSARLRYELGSGIRAIQNVLGHASIGTTDIYLRSLVGTSDPGASLLEKRFGHLGES